MKVQHEKDLFFMRHGKLDLPYKSHDEMPLGVLGDLGTEKLNPPIDVSTTKKLLEHNPLSKIPFNTIFVSPSLRTQTTAKLLLEAAINKDKALPTIITPELKEVLFDLRGMRPNQVDQVIPIQEINDLVHTAIASGEHGESAEKVFKRIESVIEKLQDMEGPILCVTHGFFLGMLQIYINNKGAVLQPLRKEDFEHTERILYTEGFSTNKKFSQLSLIKL